MPKYDEERCERGDACASVGDLSLIAFCGLYCGDCFWHTGRVMRLARELRREIKSAGFDGYARYVARLPGGKVYEDFDTCWKVLGAMTRFGCRKICREGGCAPSCGIRLCCQKKSIDGCWQCDDFKTCKILGMLDPIHEGGHMRNLRALRRKGPSGFVRGVRYWANLTRRGTARRAPRSSASRRSR